MIAHDKVRATVFVAVPPHDAFQVFTRDVDRWWRRGPRHRNATTRTGPSQIRFEGEHEGRLVESFEGGGEHEIGKVLAWEPGQRLHFEWRGSNFAANQCTEVEVTFTGKNGGTEVVLEHRGWASLPADHPVRHGQEAAAFMRRTGLWWAELLTAFREHARTPLP